MSRKPGQPVQSDGSIFNIFRKKTPSPPREGSGVGPNLTVPVNPSTNSNSISQDSSVAQSTQPTISLSSSTSTSTFSSASTFLSGSSLTSTNHDSSSSTSTPATSNNSLKSTSGPLDQDIPIKSSSKTKKIEDVGHEKSKRHRKKNTKKRSESFGSQKYEEEDHDKEKKEIDKKKKSSTAPNPINPKNPKASGKLFHKFFQMFSHPKQEEKQEQGQEEKHDSTKKNQTKHYNFDSKNTRPDYTFRVKDLCLLDDFILSVFAEITPTNEAYITSSSAYQTIANLNKKDFFEFSYAVQILSEENDNAIISSKIKKIDFNIKEVLFVIDPKNRKITAYISDPSNIATKELKVTTLDQNSAFFKVFEPVFASGKSDNIQKSELKKLLFTEPLYPGHTPAIDSVAKCFETLAVCHHTKLTLSLEENDFKIGNLLENERCAAIFDDIEMSILDIAAHFIETHQDEILTFIKKKHRIVSYRTVFTDETENFELIKQGWVASSTTRRGDVLFVYDHSEQVWKVCCKDETEILQTTIGPDTFNYAKKAQVTKSNKVEDDTETDIEESESESEKLTCVQLGADDLTEDRICEILSMIKLKKLFKPTLVEKNAKKDPEPETDAKVTDLEIKALNTFEEVKVAKVEAPESKQLANTKEYFAIPGKKKLPTKRVDRMIHIFCERYVKIFVEIAKKNCKLLAEQEEQRKVAVAQKRNPKEEAPNSRQSTLFPDPPANYVNPNPSPEALKRFSNTTTSSHVPGAS